MYFKVNFISTFFNNKKQGKKVHRDRIKSDTHNARKYRINSILSYLLIDYFSLSFFFRSRSFSCFFVLSLHCSLVRHRCCFYIVCNFLLCKFGAFVFYLCVFRARRFLPLCVNVSVSVCICIWLSVFLGFFFIFGILFLFDFI